MVALYRSVTNDPVSFDSAAKQVRLLNHSFKVDLVKFYIKPQTNNSLTCSVLQSG